jgi:hypothetical protein
MDRRAISGIIATLLLLLASIGFYMISANWFDNFTNDLELDVKKPVLKQNLKVMEVDGSSLYIKNNFKDNLHLNSIEIGDNVCDIGNVNIGRGYVNVDIGNCTQGFLSLDVKEVKIFLDEGIIVESEVLRNTVGSSGNALMVKFEMGPCDFGAGYIRMFGLTDLDNAHVDIDGSSTYNVCFKHPNYTLSFGLGGSVTQDLFYLIGKNNSAVWTDKGSILEVPSQWEDVILSSNGGVFDYQINSVQPSLEHICIGSIDLDNVYGSHYGDCNSVDLNDKIWVKLT